MKKSEIEIVKEKILDMTPCLQVDIWKSGQIPEIKNRKDCSKMIRILEDNDIIKRIKTFDKERKITTFRIEKLNGSKKLDDNDKKDKSQKDKSQKLQDDDKSKNKSNKYDALLGKDNKFSPCCGCNDDVCDATSCNKLNEWI